MLGKMAVYNNKYPSKFIFSMNIRVTIPNKSRQKDSYNKGDIFMAKKLFDDVESVARHSISDFLLDEEASIPKVSFLQSAH